jgi:meiotically up-regulated gene 157 (Mug157) protein
MVLSDSGYLPSLLSLGHLVPNILTDEYYVNTRKFILSNSNPFYFKGNNGEGTGITFNTNDYISPAGIALRGLTSKNTDEVRYCVKVLQAGHSGSGLMQIGFGVDELRKVLGPTLVRPVPFLVNW